MSAAMVEPSVSERSVPASTGWIISKGDDLVWFIGSAFAGYLAVALTSAANYKPSPTVFTFIWAILISGPHFYATATRTYLDAEQRRKLGAFIWLIIPLALALPVLLFAIGGNTLLFVVGIAWGALHVTKQHIGIMLLYKRVNHEKSKTDFLLDKWFLLISLMLPAVLFLVWYLSPPVSGKLLPVGLIAQCVLVGGYAYRQLNLYHGGQGLNSPKLLLLALVVPLHWIAFLSAATKDPTTAAFIFTIATNIGHSLQYHRLTWFHNRNRYQGKTGLSGMISRNVVYHYGTCLGLYLSVLFLGPTLVRGYGLLLMAPPFIHYLLDAKIWRVREDPELARALRLT